MAEETKSTQVTESTETETFIEEVEVKRTRKVPSKSSSGNAAASSSASASAPTAAAATAAGKGELYKVTVPLLNVREKASLVAEVVGTLQEGDVVEITAKTPKGFGKLADGGGYVKMDYVEKAENAQ